MTGKEKSVCGEGQHTLHEVIQKHLSPSENQCLIHHGNRRRVGFVGGESSSHRVRHGIQGVSGSSELLGERD
jgi:hypothetical protein